MLVDGFDELFEDWGDISLSHQFILIRNILCHLMPSLRSNDAAHRIGSEVQDQSPRSVDTLQYE